MSYGKRRDKDDSLYWSVGEAIFCARRRTGLNQKALGTRLGVTGAAISDIERAVTRPGLDDLKEIADALGVPLTQLVVLGEG